MIPWKPCTNPTTCKPSGEPTGTKLEGAVTEVGVRIIEEEKGTWLENFEG